jgi:hypothetical protein
MFEWNVSGEAAYNKVEILPRENATYPFITRSHLIIFLKEPIYIPEVKRYIIGVLSNSKASQRYALRSSNAIHAASKLGSNAALPVAKSIDLHLPIPPSTTATF